MESSLSFPLGESEKWPREKRGEIPRLPRGSSPEGILQPRPERGQKNRRFFRVHWPFVNAGCIGIRALYVHIYWTPEKAQFSVLIIGSGWPNCVALDSSFLVLDNLSRILAKILYNWRWRSIIRAYIWLMTPKCILKCQFEVSLESHQIQSLARRQQNMYTVHIS